MICVIGLLGGFIVWSVSANIEGAVVASGQIQVEQNRQVIAHRDGGEVAAVHIEEGSTVEAGELLLELKSADLESEISIVESQLFEMMARDARLQAERDHLSAVTFSQDLLNRGDTDADVAQLLAGQKALFAARTLTAEKEIEQLGERRLQTEAQIEGIAAQRDALEEQYALIGEDLEAQAELLARGLTQQSRVISLRRERANSAGQIGNLIASEAQARAQITEIELQILKASSDRRESAITTLRDVQAQRLQLRQERDSLRARLERLDVRAPLSGVIYDLAVFGPGAVVSPAEPVLYIVPQDRPLVIAARVDPIHVDQVYPGQPVRLRFSTFDSRTTPELQGTVSKVSADAFLDDATRSNYYLAEIHIDEAQRALLPEGSVLIPGMPVETFMSTGERSPLAYLTKPLMDYFIRAFRED
jgi:HlyD family secretion protein